MEEMDLKALYLAHQLNGKQKYFFYIPKVA
jgi:hypothetical protein